MARVVAGTNSKPSGESQRNVIRSVSSYSRAWPVSLEVRTSRLRLVETIERIASASRIESTHRTDEPASIDCLRSAVKRSFLPICR